MTTVTRLRHVGSWSVRCATLGIALAFCSAAFADSGKNVVASTTQQALPKKVRKICYVVLTGSAIPQPCDRLGAIPTTAPPLQTYGNSGGR